MDGVKTEGTRDPFGNIVFILPDVEYATLKCVSELLYTGSTSGPIGLKNQVKHLLRDNFFNAMFFTTSEDIVVKNVNAKTVQARCLSWLYNFNGSEQDKCDQKQLKNTLK